jgi:hypothetical protein
MSEKMYLISQNELQDLVSAKGDKMSTMINVLARPYIEKSAGSVIASSIGKGLISGMKAVDKLIEPPKKGVKKV